MTNAADFLASLLSVVISRQLTDLHIISGKHPYIRDAVGDLVCLDNSDIVSEEMVHALRLIIHPESQGTREEDMSYIHDDVTFRIHAFQDVEGTGIAFRRISRDVPSCSMLGISPAIIKLLENPQGLILVTGPTGSGKSFTLASLVDHINETQRAHIITIEDPIEFRFQDKLSVVRQRELWTHTASFPDAIRSSLRSDPDVVMVGEMRDKETISSALTLAETGHMILSTLHTNDSVQAIDRIVDIFPVQQQPQIRMQLALSLKAVIAQMLLPRADGKGRVIAREILINNDAVRNIITLGNTHQLYGVIEIARQDGMFLMDASLEHLYRNGAITRETFISHLRDKTRINS